MKAVASYVTAAGYFAIPAILILIQRDYGRYFPREHGRYRATFILLFLSAGFHRVFDTLGMNGGLLLVCDAVGAVAAICAVLGLWCYRRSLGETILHIQRDTDGRNT